MHTHTHRIVSEKIHSREDTKSLLDNPRIHTHTRTHAHRYTHYQSDFASNKLPWTNTKLIGLYSSTIIRFVVVWFVVFLVYTLSNMHVGLPMLHIWYEIPAPSSALLSSDLSFLFFFECAIKHVTYYRYVCVCESISICEWVNVLICVCIYTSRSLRSKYNMYIYMYVYSYMHVCVNTSRSLTFIQPRYLLGLRFRV